MRKHDKSFWLKLANVFLGYTIFAMCMLFLLLYLISSEPIAKKYITENENSRVKGFIHESAPTRILDKPENHESASEQVVTEEWFYYLNAEDLDLVERVVMAESGNQSLLGQMAVAQCILNQGQIAGLSAREVVTQPGQYSKPYSGEVSAQTAEAVYKVFHNGEMAVADTIQYFYSLATGRVSAWHESKIWVCTIGAHKFFKEN